MTRFPLNICRPDDRNYYRYDDRGGYGRDRYDGRRYGDRYSGDRYDSRGGYGRDRYDDRRYGDRDRYDDRRGADRYGDSERRREYDDGPSWRNMSRARDSRSDFDRDEREPGGTNTSTTPHGNRFITVLQLVWRMRLG